MKFSFCIDVEQDALRKSNYNLYSMTAFSKQFDSEDHMIMACNANIENILTVLKQTDPDLTILKIPNDGGDEFSPDEICKIVVINQSAIDELGEDNVSDLLDVSFVCVTVIASDE